MDVTGRGRRRGAASTTIGALAAAALGLAPGLAGAAVPSFAVTTEADLAGPGACESGGFCSLRQALAASETAGGSISLPAGRYQLQLGALRANAPIVNPITVTGAGAAVTTIEQTGAARVLDASALLEISGVTLTGGDVRGADGEDGQDGSGGSSASGGLAGDLATGGAIHNTGRLTLTDVVVTGNRAEGGDGGDGGDDHSGAPTGTSGGDGGQARGGAIDNQHQLTLVRTVVSGNVAQAGSGGAAGSGVNVVSGRGGPGGVGFGGGIENGGRLTLIESTVRDNAAVAGDGGASPWLQPGVGGNAQGGGISSGGAALVVERSTISGNAARGGASNGIMIAAGGSATGGGVHATHAVALRDATVTGNAVVGGDGSQPAALPAAAEGGGIWVGASATFEQVTIAANSASTSEETPASGIGGNVHAEAGAVRARGVLIAGGAGGGATANCSAALVAEGGNVEQAGTPACGLELAVADAQLAALAANGGPTETLALAAGSPAADAGSCLRLDGAPVAHDQRGQARPASGCDAGAYEYVSPADGGGDPPGGGSGTGDPRTGDPGPGGPRTGAPGPGDPRTVPPARAPRLTAVAVVRRGGRSTLRFTLDRAARVTVVYRTASVGRRRARKVATVTLRGRKGVNRVRLTGRAGRRPLAPGRYRLTVTAGSGRGASKPRSVTLTIARTARL